MFFNYEEKFFKSNRRDNQIKTQIQIEQQPDTSFSYLPTIGHKANIGRFFIATLNKRTLQTEERTRIRSDPKWDRSFGGHIQ